MTSYRTGLARNVAIMGVRRNAPKILVEDLKDRNWFELLDIDGRKIYEYR
jgi:hypothetical protein